MELFLNYDMDRQGLEQWNLCDHICATLVLLAEEQPFHMPVSSSSQEHPDDVLASSVVESPSSSSSNHIIPEERIGEQTSMPDLAMDMITSILRSLLDVSGRLFLVLEGFRLGHTRDVLLPSVNFYSLQVEPHTNNHHHVMIGNMTKSLSLLHHDDIVSWPTSINE